MPLTVRPDWLAQVTEEIVDPDRRIVDPHHHFFVASEDFPHYELGDLRDDTISHKVEQTVYLQCWEGYRSDGPEELRVVGETAWVDGIAREARKNPDAVQIGGIMGTTELRLGAAVRPVLEAHCAASTLFRGIRQAAAWDPDEDIMSMPGLDDAALYADADFRSGVAVLDEMGLVLDTYHYHHQNAHLTALARAFPGLSIVLDHLGTPLGVGPYAGRRDEIFAEWARGIAEVASCPNVTMKLGGLAMPWNGFGYDDAERPPTSDELVAAQSRYYDFAIEQFGPERCMFESNFPVDKCSLSYHVLWNAFKKMSSGYSEAEKDAMFRGTASRVYGLE
ncbi:MAG: amidohydrolase family protein [Gammaproteobacteria bacterium]|jgi:predicted TIM-barrel fold metal-dependent hydrolase